MFNSKSELKCFVELFKVYGFYYYITFKMTYFEIKTLLRFKIDHFKYFNTLAKILLF